MFHIGFKAAALVVYLLGSMLFSDVRFARARRLTRTGRERILTRFRPLDTTLQHFVMCVVTDILLLSVDFWTVKNVTGRLLVGLRWWNRVRDDGSSEWVFESHEEERKINAQDARVFWLGLYLNMAAWCLLAVTAVLSARMGWMTIIIVSLALNGSNFYGYWKCKKDAKQKLRNLLAQGLATGLTAL